MIIITLSTIPSRFHLLGPTLESLLDQTVPADAVEVWIPKSYRRFPEWQFELPEVPDGVTIRVADVDLGPATKVLPAVKAYKGTDAKLIYCDDDRIVSPRFVESFLKASNDQPNCAIASSGWDIECLGFAIEANKRQPRAQGPQGLYDFPYRWRRLKQKCQELYFRRRLPKPFRSKLFKTNGYLDIMEGCGGVFVRPDMFDDVAFDIPTKLWAVDDIWLSGMLAVRDIPIWSNSYAAMPNEQFDISDPLHASVIDGLNRHEANCACVEYFQEHFGIWKAEAT